MDYYYTLHTTATSLEAVRKRFSGIEALCRDDEIRSVYVTEGSRRWTPSVPRKTLGGTVALLEYGLDSLVSFLSEKTPKNLAIIHAITKLHFIEAMFKGGAPQARTVKLSDIVDVKFLPREGSYSLEVKVKVGDQIVTASYSLGPEKQSLEFINDLKQAIGLENAQA